METEMEFEAFSNLTDIQSFFYGKCIFLTGVTGLVGKVVLEKVLRCCPGVGKIYIHMRPKKGLTTQQRLEKLFKLELFKELKEIFPVFQRRVVVVEGDITHDRLGLSLEDFEKIRESVSILIHCAASVNFTNPLKKAVEQNVISTYKIMDLCHKMPHLKSVVHVSTAYVKREDDGSVLEEVPKVKVHPDKLIEALEWMDEKSAEAVTDYLLEERLTTYLITKAMAEVVIQDKRGDLPVALVRPCYISSTVKEPFPGWVDTLQGLSGLMLAGAKGVLRTLISIDGLKLCIVPVDTVANTIIASAWHVGITKPSPLFVINCVMDYNEVPLADEKVLRFVMDRRDKYPLMQIYRYPDFTIHYNKLFYMIHSLFQEWIPAYIIDFLLYIFTGKTILVRVYKKIGFLYGVFYRIGKDPWIFRRDNYVSLTGRLSEEDGKIFLMNMDNFDWNEYLDNCLQGGRKFLAHEDPSNIPYAKKKAKIWWAVTTFLKWFLILYFFYYLFTSSFMSPLYTSVEEQFHKLYL